MLGLICITQELPYRLLHTDPEKGRTSKLKSPSNNYVYYMYIGRQVPTPNRDIHILYIHTHIDLQYVTMHACAIQTNAHTHMHTFTFSFIVGDTEDFQSCHILYGTLS